MLLSTATADTNQTPFVNYFPGQSRTLTVYVVVFNSSLNVKLCDGTPIQALIITGANEGTYCLEVTDFNGCSGKDTITVNIVDQPVIGFDEIGTLTDSSCRVVFTIDQRVKT